MPVKSAAKTSGKVDARVLQANLLELIRRTSAELPADVVRAVHQGLRRE